MDQQELRLCKQCRKGRLYYSGNAFDGRPEFACTYCRRRITNGLDGGELSFLLHSHHGETQ